MTDPIKNLLNFLDMDMTTIFDKVKIIFNNKKPYLANEEGLPDAIDDFLLQTKNIRIYYSSDQLSNNYLTNTNVMVKIRSNPDSHNYSIQLYTVHPPYEEFYLFRYKHGKMDFEDGYRVYCLNECINSQNIDGDDLISNRRFDKLKNPRQPTELTIIQEQYNPLILFDYLCYYASKQELDNVFQKMADKLSGRSNDDTLTGNNNQLNKMQKCIDNLLQKNCDDNEDINNMKYMIHRLNYHTQIYQMDYDSDDDNEEALEPEIKELLIDPAQVDIYGYEPDIRTYYGRENIDVFIGKMYGSSRGLDLRKSNLIHFPKSLSECTNLMYLNLSHNCLEEIPEWFFACTGIKQLYVLNLSHNEITTIPESIINLTNLKKLHLNNNKLFDQIPENVIIELHENHSLTFLDVRMNESLILSFDILEKLRDTIRYDFDMNTAISKIMRKLEKREIYLMNLTNRRIDFQNETINNLIAERIGNNILFCIIFVFIIPIFIICILLLSSRKSIL